MHKLDSHQHFWKYEPRDYRWITDDMRTLQRDFLPEDLQQEIAAAGISGAISVQASQTVEETRWLLDLAARHEFIRGVVGWVPLIDSRVGETLADLAANPKLVGIRHVLQDEPDPFFMLGEDFNRGIRELKQFRLPYDLLVFERHLPQTIKFVDTHEDQVFIVDHLAKPRVKDGNLSPWEENIRQLAKRPHVYLKLSGLVTEADHHQWTAEQLKPYIETALAAFGPERTMFGSDWPVCLLASPYRRWADLVAAAIRPLALNEQERIWAGTASAAYNLAS